MPAFPPDLAALATSLRIAGAPVSRDELLVALVDPAIDSYSDLLAREAGGSILETFAQRLQLRHAAAASGSIRWHDPRRRHRRARSFRVSCSSAQDNGSGDENPGRRRAAD